MLTLRCVPARNRPILLILNTRVYSTSRSPSSGSATITEIAEFVKRRSATLKQDFVDTDLKMVDESTRFLGSSLSAYFARTGLASMFWKGERIGREVDEILNDHSFLASEFQVGILI